MARWQTIPADVGEDLLSDCGFRGVFTGIPVIDDRTLLQRYVAHRDDDAFAEVVRRHLPFVYSAALRRLGHDTHQAQDVAQLVFCALAREARHVARYPVLGGWLYTATRNAVINTVRGEQRRRTREEEASYMQQIDSESDVSADWSKLRPVLDSAMDRLSDRDREAVLLRFFHGRSFGEIGATVGLSEDAARKRIDRALAKLRDLLRPHGVASTSTALAALLASQPVSAAPAGLLASVTGAALATGGAAGVGVTTFIAMTKLQAGIAAGIVLAGAIGLITQQRTISALRKDAAIARQQLAQLTEGNAPAGRGGRGGSGTPMAGSLSGASVAASERPPTARGELFAETSAALRHGKVPERYFAFVAVLQKLTRDNWREVVQAFEEERKRTGLWHPEVFDIFARRAGEVAGEDAVSYFLKLGWGGDANEAMIGWASKSPVEALQWLGRDADVETRRRVMGAAIRGLAFVEPDLAVKTLEDQPVKDRAEHADGIITSMLRSAGLDAVQRMVEGMIVRATAAGSLKDDYLRQIFADYSFKRIAQLDESSNVAEAVSWLNPHIGQPYVDRRVIAETAARFARQDPQEALRWLEAVNTTLLRAGEESTVGYRVVLDTWKAKQGAPAVETWLQTQTAHPHYDHIAWQYAALVVEQDANQALQWANTIKSAKIKHEVLQVIGKRTSKSKS